jgi:hypothetical protein
LGGGYRKKANIRADIPDDAALGNEFSGEIEEVTLQARFPELQTGFRRNQDWDTFEIGWKMPFENPFAAKELHECT